MKRAEAPQPTRSRLLLPVLGAAHFLVVLDVTIVNMALPALQTELGLSPTGLHWVVTAYAVTFGGSLLLAGRLGDLVGHRRVFVTGLVTFTLTSIGCGLAWSGPTLVVARIGQGVGAALLSPAAFSLLLSTSHGVRERNRAIATWGSIGSLGAVMGIVLGGALTEAAGWRSIFLVNVPVGLAALVALPFVVAAGRPSATGRLDVVAGALATLGVGAFALALSDAPLAGWTSPSTAVTAAVGVVAVALFARRDRRAADPLLPWALLAEARFLVPAVLGLVQGGAVLGMLFLLAAYLPTAHGLSALETAAALLVLRVPALGWAGVVGRLVTRFGAEPALVGGTALLAAGLWLLAAIRPDGQAAWATLPALLILGLAIPASFVPASVAALAPVPVDRTGIASGLLKALQWIGGALGIALVAATSGGLDTAGADARSLSDGARAGFLALAVVTTGAAMVACHGFVRVRRARLATAC
ncbi:MAG TPA: MFS transporter [Gaiella sp.]|nr:MFS transporter [Gaiella sp.]